jgi:hypothetical protein
MQSGKQLSNLKSISAPSLQTASALFRVGIAPTFPPPYVCGEPRFGPAYGIFLFRHGTGLQQTIKSLQPATYRISLPVPYSTHSHVGHYQHGSQEFSPGIMEVYRCNQINVECHHQHR